MQVNESVCYMITECHSWTSLRALLCQVNKWHECGNLRHTGFHVIVVLITSTITLAIAVVSTVYLWSTMISY